MIHDLDVNNYTISELLKIFKFEQNTEPHIIISKITDIINKIGENVNENKYKQFMNSVKNKFIIHFEKNNSKTIVSNNKYEQSNTFGSHAVIEQKITPVENVYNYAYPSSKLNPIERRTMTKNICFNTLFRSDYETTNSNNVYWVLPFRLEHVISMRLTDLQLPIEYYMFSAKNKNNIFNIKLFNMVDFPDANIDIIIPDGNYIVDDFVTSMNNYFSNYGMGLQNLYLTIDPITSHTIIRAKNENDVDYETIHYPYDPLSAFYSPDFYFELTFSGPLDKFNVNLQLNAGWLMGYNKPKYTIKKENKYIAYTSKPNAITNNVVTYYAYCEGNMGYGSSAYNYVFLHVDDYNNNYYNTMASLTNNSYIGNNILAKINITGNPNSQIFNNGSDLIFKNREYFGPVTIERLHTMLLDIYGKPIELYNNNFSFSLEFTILYTA